VHVLEVRNVHDALPRGLQLLREQGVSRQSRAGEVLVAREPVTTVYRQPLERVLFWPQRDANPAFHLYESLWMLAGRRDLAPLLQYVTTFGEFSDDGETLHGAYGHRWFHHFGVDQLVTIASRLMHDPDDRRCLLQMWDPSVDLGRAGRDVPCNTAATFQVSADGNLDLTVFCRSNDIVWGAYGANAVHFSILLEYMSRLTGIPVGVYRQVSVNYHAYRRVMDTLGVPTPSTAQLVLNPYNAEIVRAARMPEGLDASELSGYVDRCDWQAVDRGDEWTNMVCRVLMAHHTWRTSSPPGRFTEALEFVAGDDLDFCVAMEEWLLRRQARWEERHGQ